MVIKHRVTTYPYGTKAVKVCENEMLSSYVFKKNTICVATYK